jgi:hypothetical protein
MVTKDSLTNVLHSNHWDRLSKDIQTRVLSYSDPLTQYLNGHGRYSKTKIKVGNCNDNNDKLGDAQEANENLLDHDPYDCTSALVWEEAAKIDWGSTQDNLELLPDKIQSTFFIDHIRSKRMYRFVKDRLIVTYRDTQYAMELARLSLMKVAMKHGWFEEVVADYSLVDVIKKSCTGPEFLSFFESS